MTTAIAQQYIDGRMRELGYANSYYIRLRHYVLRPRQTVTIQADSHMFLLINPAVMIRVQSAFGIYDLTVETVNELQYEHMGNIEVENYANHRQHIEFLQVIIHP